MQKSRYKREISIVIESSVSKLIINLVLGAKINLIMFSGPKD